MSRSNRLFSEEEMEILNENPYTYKVTQNQLHFTAKFKQLFWEKYCKGMTPRQIVAECGYDPEMLGTSRIMGIQQHICNAARKGESFHTGAQPRGPKKPPETPEEELKQLKGEVEYLRQEVDFLKKISSVRISGKPGKS
ncbi:MAG: HTH domain-containing protein [Prevotella sp.]|nr:HTH domain-containing protein [Prevotella sp.]